MPAKRELAFDRYARCFGCITMVSVPAKLDAGLGLPAAPSRIISHERRKQAFSGLCRRTLATIFSRSGYLARMASKRASAGGLSRTGPHSCASSSAPA